MKEHEPCDVAAGRWDPPRAETATHRNRWPEKDAQLSCAPGSPSLSWTACADQVEFVPTPSVVIDVAVLRQNIVMAARLADRGSVTLRPHVKTHKSLRIATMQMKEGASGLTASKPTEAAVFLRAGAPLVTVAYPVLRRQSIDMLVAAAAEGGGQVRFVVDSDAGAAALASAAQQHRIVFQAFMEVDTGLRRCGVQSSSPEAVKLARSLGHTPGIDFVGLFSHAGHAYAAGDAAGVHVVAAQERADLLLLAGILRGAKIEIRELSVGCTPTFFFNDGFDGFTEIRPGNYVFMDLVQVGLGVAQFSDIALQVLATVVSANAEFAIIDAGSKVLSSDKAPHGSDTLAGHGMAIALNGGLVAPVVKLSEEHGFVAQPEIRPFRAGERVRVLPNHACPVANLASSYLILDPSGQTERWPVDARGMVFSEHLVDG